MAHFIFQIRPLTIEEGFELTCSGIFADPKKHRRLYDAVIQSIHVGLNLDAEIRILDCEGSVADIIPINPPALKQNEVA